MTKERKTKVMKVTMKVLGTTLEIAATAALATVGAVIGGKIALNEFTKDGVDVKVNKVVEAAINED